MHEVIRIIVLVVTFGSLLSATLSHYKNLKRRSKDKEYYMRLGWEACENWMTEMSFEEYMLRRVRKKDGS